MSQMQTYQQCAGRQPAERHVNKDPGRSWRTRLQAKMAAGMAIARHDLNAGRHVGPAVTSLTAAEFARLIINQTHHALLNSEMRHGHAEDQTPSNACAKQNCLEYHAAAALALLPAIVTLPSMIIKEYTDALEIMKSESKCMCLYSCASHSIFWKSCVQDCGQQQCDF